MSKKLTAVLFAVALFLGSLTLATAEAPATVSAPAVSLDFQESPPWMMPASLGAGCTYPACMRGCRQHPNPPPWIECHTTCNADCNARFTE